MSIKLAAISLIVDDYDKAINHYCNDLGFHLIEDTPRGEKRWVVVAPEKDSSCQFVLARASNPTQSAAIGNQGAGRVWLFLQTDDFDKTFEYLRGNDIQFLEQPRTEEYGKVVVFKDAYGNKWDLIQRY